MSKRSATFLSACGKTLALLGCVALTGCQTTASSPDLDAADPTPPKRIVTQGRAQTVIENLNRCPEKVKNHRISGGGQITATDGTVITVPAETAFQKKLGLLSVDMYNECNQVLPTLTAEVSTTNVPIVEVDPGGEVITGYSVADSYFELYVNGKLVTVDNTPFTPFNSVIVKFRAKRPITYAIRGVDWDENLGLGTELNGKDPWHPGDGGVIAKFSDSTVTDSSWKAQSFYIGPLNSPDEVVERGHLHDTTPLGRVHPVAKKPPCQDKCYAVHYPVPANWQSPRINDKHWPRAYEYTDTDIGVTSLPAYTRYPELFEGARWIWTVNLVFDNHVIRRKTVP